MKRSIGYKNGVVAVLALAVAASGCAARADRGGFDCNRQWGMGTLGGALAGAALGGGLGGGIVATAGDLERQDNDYATGAGIGFVSGALLGGLFGHCAFDPRHVEAAPPPPPPPPPPPAPPVRRKIILRGVNFDFDKASIRPDAADILNEGARILKDEPGVDVSVGGHTDAIGTDDYNQRLSERRAQAVRDYLVGQGISAGRLSTSGFGEAKPVATNESEEGRAQNRRVELNILGGPEGSP